MTDGAPIPAPAGADLSLVALDPAGAGAKEPRRRWPRLLLLLAPAFALLAGLDAALVLLGLPAPVTATRLPLVHGMLLVAGFVGGLISLERAVALRHTWGLVAPALLGAGAVLLLSPGPLRLGQALMTIGGCVFLAVYVPLWRRQRDEAVLTQALGAVLLVGALTLWMGGVSVSTLLPWLVGFVVLTIAGERLELARITMGPTAGRDLLALAGLVATAVAASLLWPGAYAVLGLALLALVVWLAAHDVARRTIRSTGLPRFSAGCLLVGYLWLGVAASVWMVGGPALEGPRYDAVVHATFLGFTISMIMAHAPVILPAILRRPLPYHRAMIGPAVLLHLSLALRIWVGDGLEGQLQGDPVNAWRVGGVLNVVAVLAFLLVAAWSVARRVRAQARS